MMLKNGSRFAKLAFLITIVYQNFQFHCDNQSLHSQIEIVLLFAPQLRYQFHTQFDESDNIYWRHTDSAREEKRENEIYKKQKLKIKFLICIIKSLFAYLFFSSAMTVNWTLMSEKKIEISLKIVQWKWFKPTMAMIKMNIYQCENDGVFCSTSLLASTLFWKTSNKCLKCVTMELIWIKWQ